MRLRLCGFDSAGSRAAGSAASKGQQRDIAGALDGHAKPALVTSADASHAARQDFAAFLHELGKNVGALVVDEVHLFDTKFADFLLTEKLPLASARSARAAAGATFATSAATAAGTTFATATAAAVAARATMTAVSSARGTAFTARRGG